MSAPSETAPVAKHGLWGWMLFDWAAQPFFTVVTTFIFGPYFVARLTEDPVSAQAMWSNMATISSLVIAVFSPILGSIADKSGARKPWIATFAVVKIASLCMLWFAAPGSPIFWPVLFMILASIAAEFSIVFNDSMMPRLVSHKEIGKISNIAWGLGYLGGMIVLIALVLLVAASPETGLTILGNAPIFGLDAAAGEDARIVGPVSALWYLVFILPMFLFTPDAARGIAFVDAVREGLRELRSTLSELASRRALARFLIARMLYQDGVNALLVLGAVFAAGMFGWATLEIGIYGILLNVVAIGGCGLASWVDRHIGSKNVVIIGLVLLITATLGMVSTGPGYTFFGLITLPVNDGPGLFSTGAEKVYVAYGLLIGVAFGPVQASSRSFLARNVDIAESGRYFGIYALTGRATSFMATLLFSLTTYASGSAHLGMSTLLLFLCSGLFILLGVPGTIRR